MKNYYEILEVDKKASPEVIEKAYKTLVKKYHPDLQEAENNGQYEEKMKEINEAYSVLSDEFKRRTYDEQIQENMVPEAEYIKVEEENQELRNRLQNMRIQNYTNVKTNVSANNYKAEDKGTISNIGRIMYENIAREYNAHAQEMENRNYRRREKHDFKYYMKFTGCLAIVILFFILIYQIPFIKRFFNSIYEENLVIQALVNVIRKTFSTKIM